MPTRIEREPDDTFPTVILWLNDLKEIVAIIEKGTGSKAVLSDGEYEYDSLDEFTEHHGETVPYLSIGAKSADYLSVALTIGKGQNTFYVTGPSSQDEKKTPIYHAIRNLLEEKRPSISYLSPLYDQVGPKVTFLIGLAFTAVTVLILIGESYRLISNEVALCIAITLVLLQLCFYGPLFTSLSVSEGGFTKVYLVTPHKKQPGFVARNWDKILVGGICSLLTMLIMLIPGLFKSKPADPQPAAPVATADPKGSATPTPQGSGSTTPKPSGSKS